MSYEHDKEYLYADNETDSTMRSVFTSDSKSQNQAGVWEFSTDDDVKSFFIKNIKFDEYLYTEDEGPPNTMILLKMFTLGLKTPP